MVFSHVFPLPGMKESGHLSSSLWITTILLFLTNVDYVTSLGKRGEPCTHDTECDQLSFIECSRITKTCDCPSQPPLQLYYSLEEKCVSFVDGVCTYVKSINLPAIKCVENALCFKDRDPMEVNGRCVCKSGFYRTKGNQCAKNQPPPSKSNAVGDGSNSGGEVGRNKNGGEGRSNLASTRYPEPYHSKSTASRLSSPTSSTLLFFFIPLDVFLLFSRLKLMDVF